MYESEFGDNELNFSDNDDDDGDNDDKNTNDISYDKIPSNAYVLVPAGNVTKRSSKGGKKKAVVADEEQDWMETNDAIREAIETSLPIKKVFAGHNIARSILGCKQFSVSANGRTVMINDPDPDPKTALPLLDFIMAATRQSGPSEVADSLMAKYARILLQCGTPRAFFKNKSLLSATTKQARKRKSVSVDYDYPSTKESSSSSSSSTKRGNKKSHQR